MNELEIIKDKVRDIESVLEKKDEEINSLTKKIETIEEKVQLVIGKLEALSAGQSEPAATLRFVSDVFHPEDIPQLDGNTTEISNPTMQQEKAWICHCCTYASRFETEKELGNHHNNTHSFIEYEECNVCYPWHVWT